MITSDERKAAAERLRTAERDSTPIVPLSKTLPGIDVVDAYEIQLMNIRHRIEGGANIRGHKVGLSSPAMQQMMGVDEPDYGHLVDDMFILEGTTVATDRLCQPRVEVEVAFVLGQLLSGPGCTVADVLRATDFLLPSIEIIDSRIENWDITLADTIADNASSGRVVLGGNPVPLHGFDVRLIGVLLRRNGRIIETGAAGAVLGNPASAIAWLANKVHQHGVSLEAGHVIMPGSCTRAVDVTAGDLVTAERSDLPLG
jgi:2-keto-4-pentenoate hydratase